MKINFTIEGENIEECKFSNLYSFNINDFTLSYAKACKKGY